MRPNRSYRRYVRNSILGGMVLDPPVRGYSLPVVATPGFRALVRSLEDRRVYTPDYLASPRGTSRASQRIVASYSVGAGLAPTFSFGVPAKVARCVRRKERRSVIHALGLAGKGSRARRRKRDFYSNVEC